MSSLTPSTLDAMVIGDPSIGEDDWTDLVIAPKAAYAWTVAMARRDHRDRVARVVLAHPWLATHLLALRRRARLAPAVLSAPVTLVRGAFALGVLDAGERSAEPPTVLSWGREQLVPVKLGDQTSFDVPPGVVLLYRTADGEGRLSPSGWRLEPRDAPVLIVAVRPGATEVRTVAEAVAIGPAAAAILVEA